MYPACIEGYKPLFGTVSWLGPSRSSLSENHSVGQGVVGHGHPKLLTNWTERRGDAATV